MGNKNPTGQGGRQKGRPKRKMSERWSKVTPVKEQLKGYPCNHPKGKIEVKKNRKGKEYLECDACGAFLGWV